MKRRTKEGLGLLAEAFVLIMAIIVLALLAYRIGTNVLA
jgi:hypothetical protein